MRAIKRRKIFDDLVRMLGDRQLEGQEKRLFPSMREVQVFAAYLGYSSSRKGTIEGETLEIDSRIFSNSEDAMPAIDLIALASTSDLSILTENREEERIRIFEEYADGGFQILTEWIQECPNDTFGDKAIIAGMIKLGYLSDDPPQDASTVIKTVVF